MTTRTAAPTKLQNIAAEMRALIVTAGAAYSHQRLTRGLEIVLQRKLEDTGAIRWRLALARTGVAPSPEEIAICRDAFNVPVGSEDTTSTKERTNAKTSTTTTWHVVEVCWYETH